MSRKMLLMSKGWKKQMDPHSRLRLAPSADYSFRFSELFYIHLLLFIFYARRRIPTHQGQSPRCSHLQPDNTAPCQRVTIKISPCVRRNDDASLIVEMNAVSLIPKGQEYWIQRIMARNLVAAHLCRLSNPFKGCNYLLVGLSFLPSL
jgi:hypothetical protein